MRQRSARLCLDPSVRVRVALATVVLASISLDAHATKVVTANSSNNQLSLIDFDASPNVIALNFDANERKSLQAIAIRDDLASGVHLIVADAQASEICWYADPVVDPQSAGRCRLIGSPTLSPGPQLPGALALNATGDLFALTSGSGSAASKTAEIWAYPHVPGCVGSSCRPGDYLDPIRLSGPMTINITPGAASATLVPLELLEEARVFTSASSRVIEQGDLLVLAGRPAALVRLAGVGAAPFTTMPQAEVLIYPAEAAGVDPLRKFPAGAEPGGFDFAPGNRLLVTNSNGTVLAYNLAGERLADFAAGLGNGKFKIDVALQGSRYRAFVADRNGGELLRFDIDANGTGGLSGSVAQGVQFPVAVAATNANVAATPAGLGITSSPTQGVLKSTFRQVQVPGFTSGTVYLVGDPRDHSGGNGGTFWLSDVDAMLPDIEIAEYFRGLPVGDEEAFVVIVQSTSADFTGALEVVLDPAPVLGWDPPCTRTDAGGGYIRIDERLRVLWGTLTSLGEAPILEGPTLINQTIGCGSGRGIVREASIFAAGRDARPPAEQTSTVLTRLGELLAGADAAAIPRAVLRTLTQRHAAAVRDLSRQNYVSTRDNLLALAQTAATVVAPGRIGPELESRARAGAFAVCSIEDPDRVPACTVP